MTAKNIKIIVAIMVFAVLTICFGGCSADGKNDEAKIKIVTTIFPPYDFARQIISGAEDGIFELTMLISPGEEIHSYEPSPKDIVKISECDIFIYNGGPSDNWIENILSSIENMEMETIAMMSCVNTLEEEIVEGMQLDEHEHSTEKSEVHEDAELDEHVWTSPKNAVIITERIADTIVSKLTEKLGNEAEPVVELCRSNYENYKSELEDISAELTATVLSSESNTVIFGDRFPFRYLAHDYGIKYYAAFPGCSNDSEPSSATITFLIEKVKTENIPAVFYIEFSNEKMADTICEETGAKKLLLHSCHNVTKTDFETGTTYAQLMKNNIAALREALGNSVSANVEKEK